MNERLKIDKKWFIIINIIFILFISFILVLTSLDNGKIDLLISKNIANVYPGSRYTDNIFAKIVSIFGEMPIYVVSIFSLYGLEYAIRDINKRRKFINLVRIIVLIIGISLGVFMFHRLCKYIYIATYYETDKVWSSLLSISIFLTLPASLVLNFSLYYLVNKLSLDKRTMLHLSIVGIIAVLSGYLIIEILKTIISRNRYGAIVYLANSDFETYFTAWYKKGIKFEGTMGVAEGMTDDSKSFPSGHTQAASTSLFLAFLPFYFAKYNDKKYKLWFFITPVVYILIVMFGRVLAGAHYLSDVTFGLIIGLICIMVPFLVDYKYYLVKNSVENI